MRNHWTIALALAGVATALGQDGKLERGAVLRLYDVGEAIYALPDLVEGQKPNVARVVQGASLQKPTDFAPLSDNFLTQLEFWLDVPTDGVYEFRLTSDDGSRLLVNQALVIDHDGTHGPTPAEGKAALKAGRSHVLVLHFDAGGGELLDLAYRPPGKPEFQPIPADAIWCSPGTLETSPGRKRVIPPLRRGKPGDGRPLAGMHPGFRLETIPSEVDQVVKPAPGSPVTFTTAALPDQFNQAVIRHTVSLGEVAKDSIIGQPLISDPSQDAIYRVFVDSSGEGGNACVFRFATIAGAADAAACWVTDGGACLGRPTADRAALHPTHRLTPGEKAAFEMLAVRAMQNGVEIEFTRPLDPRVGWDPDSYLVELWPFDAAKKLPATRDGKAAAVKSASVLPDRRRVFLELDGLKASRVVYLRLLPPCISEDGEPPLSTEAWYTLVSLPTDRRGAALPRPPQPPQNVLTDAEKAEGWKLLFDGKSTAGWRGFKNKVVPAGWKAIEGCLVRVGSGGDIITDEEFDDFELKLEWRISPGGNSGIFFRVGEADDLRYVWETAPEMQVLDNSEHADGRSPLTSAGSNYALHAPTKDVTRPVGLFNEVRLVVRGGHVEHWLNGEKIVEYELGSPEWKKLVEGSKFRSMPRYGSLTKGHIALQDHGDRVWYRNIKIRPLTPN